MIIISPNRLIANQWLSMSYILNIKIYVETKNSEDVYVYVYENVVWGVEGIDIGY